MSSESIQCIILFGVIATQHQALEAVVQSSVCLSRAASTVRRPMHANDVLASFENTTEYHALERDVVNVYIV
jgi:hypothetical protein